MKAPRECRKVSVIGLGKVGTAVAAALESAGYEVALVYDTDEDAVGRALRRVRARKAESLKEAALGADIVLITTPDGAIREVCDRIASQVTDLEGKIVAHVSGARSLSDLEAAADRGGEVMSIHPLQTFADLEGALESLPGSSFGVTCRPGLLPWAESIVSALGGNLLPLDDDDKVLYHAAAVVACNLVTMVLYGAQAIYERLGLSEKEARAFMPLVRATVENAGRLGPVDALTGPLSRGDLETIKSHIQALDEIDVEISLVYRTVSRLGLRLVEERGELPPDTIARMRQVLEQE